MPRIELPEPPRARSWTEIDQAVAPRRLSPRGRLRLFFSAGNLALTALVAGVSGWAAWEIGRTVNGGETTLAAPVEREPVREIVLLTDGVLDQAWVERMLALPRGATLMDLDLFALRDRLLAAGQVASAELRRQFPDTLVVSLEERAPVLRVLVQEPGELRKSLLVARDGVVYEGIGYDSLLVNALPFLDGVRLRRSPRGYEPVAGMADVAQLIADARNNAPHLFRDWRVVSLARWADYGEILVRTREVPQVVFSRADDFTRQLARLDYIVDYTRGQPAAVLRRIDLSLGDQVPVELAAGTVAPRPSLPFPSTNRPKRRDL